MDTKESILKQYFGYDTFREGQAFLIDNILNGNNVVGVMPTGSGKSLCYQVPALLLKGITIVISPLISLMKDQVNSLTQIGINAAYINSSLTQSQYFKVIDNAKNNKYKIIYVAPERLLNGIFLNFVANSNIEMLCVDEAHCISQWGQDFRPSYQKISEFLELLPRKPIVSAFTATATKEVTKDIINQLKLVNPKVLITGFDRKNLYFAVEKPKNKKQALLDFLQDKKDRVGIVYCSTRKDVESVSEFLCVNGFLSKPYHAGLSDNIRSKNQEDFIFDRVNIVVATNAFGMGIDKSNVSYIVHYNMPKNIESYYQEAGRAGRDGSDSVCILYYSAKDVNTNSWLIENGQGNDYPNPETEELIKASDRERLKKMTFYCHTSGCLRDYILRYFGEYGLNYCGNCSTCDTNFEIQDITIDSQKVLSCVFRAKERYGINIIISVLRGSKNKKILDFNLNNLSTYGIMDYSERTIREIINFLILEKYLDITSTEFPILKLGEKSSEILKDRKQVEMKTLKDIEKKPSNNKANRTAKSVNSILFEMLKKIRLSIANAQNVPAFIVFSDSTLVDMCMKLPQSKDELLNVSGIGQVKSEKYGDEFLSEIKKYLDMAKTDESLIKDVDNDSIIDIQIYDENITLGVLADSINCLLLQKGIKKISGKTISSWLLHEKLIEYKDSLNDKSKYLSPTISGFDAGLVLEQKTSASGSPYYSLLSSKKSSKFIVDRVDNITIF